MQFDRINILDAQKMMLNLFMIKKQQSEFFFIYNI